jgi:hypothetical protein
MFAERYLHGVEQFDNQQDEQDLVQQADCLACELTLEQSDGSGSDGDDQQGERRHGQQQTESYVDHIFHVRQPLHNDPAANVKDGWLWLFVHLEWDAVRGNSGALHTGGLASLNTDSAASTFGQLVRERTPFLFGA